MPKDSDNGSIANLLKCANVTCTNEHEALESKSIQVKYSYKPTKISDNKQSYDKPHQATK